jgi:large subunit ribosomal protein L21
MYAIFKSGGKQHRAIKGAVVRIEKVDFTPEKEIVFDGFSVSPSGVNKVKIHGEPMGIFAQDKVIIFKKTQRHTFKQKTGHRQKLLWVKIKDVVQA